MNGPAPWEKMLGPAADFWQRFIDKHPHNVEAWAELGYVYWFLGGKKIGWISPQRAPLAFTKAVELGLDDGGLVWDRIGHLYQEQDRWKEAEKAYRQAAKKIRNNSAIVGRKLDVPQPT